MLFMKGTPDIPQCGFSRRVVAILDNLGALLACSPEAQVDHSLAVSLWAGVDYGAVNVLEDEEIRAAIKTFS
mgnify:CR=1 FL=1